MKQPRWQQWVGWLVLIVGFVLLLVRTQKSREPKEPKERGSAGVRAIRDWLRRNGIPFQEEYPVTINGRRYRFDFYIPVRNLLIEFDGVQHFERIPFFHPRPGDFEAAQQRDRIKTQWARDSDTGLIRIAAGDNIPFHLTRGFQSAGLSTQVYLSSSEKYEYLQINSF